MLRKTSEWYKINVMCRAERTNSGPNDEKKSGIRRTGSDSRAFGAAYDKILAEVRFVNSQPTLMYRPHDMENLAFNVIKSGDGGGRGHP
jgi:hypothetical protein